MLKVINLHPVFSSGEDTLYSVIMSMSIALAKLKPNYYFSDITFECNLVGEPDGFSVNFTGYIRNDDGVELKVLGNVHLNRLIRSPIGSTDLRIQE